MKFSLDKSKVKKVLYFISVMFGVFGLTFIILDFVGFVPRSLNLQNIITDFDLPKNKENLPETLTRPNKIVIEKIGVNPKSGIS